MQKIMLVSGLFLRINAWELVILVPEVVFNYWYEWGYKIPTSIFCHMLSYLEKKKNHEFGH